MRGSWWVWVFSPYRDAFENDLSTQRVGVVLTLILRGHSYSPSLISDQFYLIRIKRICRAREWQHRRPSCCYYNHWCPLLIWWWKADFDATRIVPVDRTLPLSDAMMRIILITSMMVHLYGLSEGMSASDTMYGMHTEKLWCTWSLRKKNMSARVFSEHESYPEAVVDLVWCGYKKWARFAGCCPTPPPRRPHFHSASRADKHEPLIV